MILPKTISFDNKENLIKNLSKLKININRRTDGREQDNLEYGVLKKYLLLICDEFKYPINIIKRESPDFIINDNGNLIGIEITEATSEYYQELLTYISKHPEYKFEKRNIQYGRKYTKKELYSLLRPKNSSITGSGWSGDGPEILASNWAYDAFWVKVKKIMKWNNPKDIRILLYDNTPTVTLYMDKFRLYLNQKFSVETSLYNIRCDLLSKDGKYVITNIQNSNKTEIKNKRDNLQDDS